MIPAELYDQGVMLCSPSNKTHPDVDVAVKMLDDAGTHVFDMKYDGVRALAFVSDGIPKLINRRGVDITYRYPEIETKLAETYAKQDIILDGEVVVMRADGTADFAATHLRDAQQNVHAVNNLVSQHPASLMAFDLLRFHADDLRNLPYRGRHAVMATQAAAVFDGTTLRWSKPRPDGLEYWREIRESGQEGLVAKALKAPYRSGRRSEWIKLKVAFQVSVVATGMTAGKGQRREKFGALEMSLVTPDGKIARVGEVGTGFTDKDLALIKPRMEAGELLVLEVEFTALTKEGKFRFPSFKGLRTDKVPTDCTTDQLEGVPIV